MGRLSLDTCKHVAAEKAKATLLLSVCQHEELQSCQCWGFFFLFFLSHKPFSNNALIYSPWIQSTWNRWAAPGDREIVFALSGAPFWQGAHPDCKCTREREKKRNKTQSLKSLSRHWLIHICLALFLTNKMLRGSRINTTQGGRRGALVVKVHNSQTKADLTGRWCSG